MDSMWLRRAAALLLLATGLIDIPYGWYFVAGYASYVWYGMGAIYLVLATVMARNVRPRFSLPLAFGYTLFLLAAWAAGGNRDLAAYIDKAIEVVLAISLAQLIRITWPSIQAHASSPQVAARVAQGPTQIAIEPVADLSSFLERVVHPS